ncbi:phosphoethanolamine transferase [Ideonella sp. A 288]|uniref:phosphoethanolamine transferase n=1 Tax=Ideonella sp. A 288 TaxID=1962181 RepID=UPI000B4BB0E6|nr:phosphoethanolamine--lipid A transferase [Ideonella sp. A 288]
MSRLFRTLSRPGLSAGASAAGPSLPTDALVLLVCVWFAATGNGAFWRGWLDGRALAEPGTWGTVAAVGLVLVALQFMLIAPFANRWTVRPLLALLVLVAAFAGYYIDRFGIVIDTSMLRNVLRTDVKEARELFAWALLPHLLLHAVPPLWLLWRVQPRRRPLAASWWRRVLAWLAVAAIGTAALLSVFQDAAATMRNQKALRFLVTPANVAWSLAVVLGQDTRTATRPREAIGLDASRGPRASAPGRRPMRVVLVLGETARAANWGLNGYARQTTPRLAALPDVIPFAQVTSCGTNTEVSVPCLFSPWGRRQYDEARIRGSQTLLHVLHRAGVQVFWRDNQSGCKGVCDGLPNETVSAATAPGFCDGERCFDEGLLQGLDARLSSLPAGDQFVVLHQLGNHGPAYDRRYPDAFRRFVPVCDTADLRRCSREQIVNAYDNALLYTDHVLAQAIEWLRRASASHDTVLLYVSDHGESLGENGLYLHGLPYALAPDEQTRVPMLVWFSDAFATGQHLDLACVRQRAAKPASHDHLFHSVLGLLDVSTRLHDPAMDLFGACRR